MSKTYFNIERDRQFPCFCQACLVGKTNEQMSKRDIRYCVECQGFIEEEYRTTAENHGRNTQYKPILEVEQIAHEEMDVSKQEEVLLHTKSENVHAYQNPTRDSDFVELNHRPEVKVGGRPKKEIPIDLIHTLSGKGLSIGKIVKQLKGQGQTVSAMTVSRILSGQRE